MDTAAGILVAVIAALGGFAVGWVARPAAQVAAEETRLKNERRRQIVAEGRAVVAQTLALPVEVSPWDFLERDPRFLALRPHVPVLAADMGGYSIDEMPGFIDELERRWNLV